MTLPRAWRRLRTGPQRSRRARSPEPLDSARAAGLRYVCDTTTPGIRRLGKTGGFRYVGPTGRRVGSADRQRIHSLVIPPAWTNVWICPLANGHVQATGRDARGRKQYRYHPRWREVRDDVKYGRLVAFARALPRIRARTGADLKRSGLPREKILALVVQLLAKTFIRVGNEEYARANGAIGLTTMKDRHAVVAGSSVRFEFRGKSGVRHTVDLHDKRLTRVIRACRDLPGQELFQWIDDAGVRQSIDSADVNGYLREASGSDFSAKDFRTWAGTVLAVRALNGLPAWESAAQARRNVVRCVDEVSKQLGNTKAVCRKSYIHPAVLDTYAKDRLALGRLKNARRAGGLTAEESGVVRLLLDAATVTKSSRAPKTLAA